VRYGRIMEMTRSLGLSPLLEIRIVEEATGG